MIEIGATLNQRFLLQKELGRGGMGAVYSASDQLLQRKVAIKVLKEQSGEEVGKRLRLEAQIAARLLHDNVVRIYDFGQTEMAYFLVMEEVDGTSYSKRWRQLLLVERLRILAQVADALDYAHHQGVVHRDVKPGNVLVTSNDVPKLTDFGLSMITEHGDSSGVVRGTPHYMSPEQTKGSRLDHRTDLYSFGVMLYESATGGVPFKGPSVAIMTQHCSVEPDRPRVREPLLSEELDTFIMALLDKRPEARPASGSIVAQALREEIERIRERDRAAAGTATTAVWGSASATAGPTTPTHTERQPNASGPIASGPAVPSVPTAARQAVPSVSTEPAPPPSSHAASTTPGTDRVTPSAVASVGGTGGITALIRSPLVRRMLENVLAEPILLSPDERYLCGHYLAYLLGGSRRHGLFKRRKIEHRNADRARMLLAMCHAVVAGGTEAAIADAAALLEHRIEVRPTLSPIVVAKYIACRDTPAKRKVFREIRLAVAEKSAYGRKHMIDAKGVLNPGLMPQKLEDLQLLAPPRDEVDDVLVERWNRVADVWRNETAFRSAVFHYAASAAHRDAASASLWPEVVYPLIERARWHRQIRSRTETAWDYIWGRMLRLPAAGVVLDRAIRHYVPAPLVAQLDESLKLMVDDLRVDGQYADPFAAAAPAADPADRLASSIMASPINLAEIAQDHAEDKALVELTALDPLRFFQGQLHEIWKESVQALQNQTRGLPSGKRPSQTHIPVGPYRLGVIPSFRGHAAGQVVIQGMATKQIELLTPTIRTKGSGNKPIVAIWTYSDNSLAIVHLDFMNSTRYVIWHAPKGHQLKFDDPGDFNHELYSLGMEIPDQLDRVLSRHFKPSANA